MATTLDQPPPPRAHGDILLHLEAIHPLAERLCALARSWHRSAGEDLGSVLDGDPSDRQAATDALEAAQDTHRAAMALLVCVELRLARARAAVADPGRSAA